MTILKGDVDGLAILFSNQDHQCVGVL